jgi:hypothetical protein
VLAVNGILILTHLHKKKKVEEPAEKSGDPILSSLRKEHPQDWGPPILTEEERVLMSQKYFRTSRKYNTQYDLHVDRKWTNPSSSCAGTLS